MDKLRSMCVNEAAKKLEDGIDKYGFSIAALAEDMG